MFSVSPRASRGGEGFGVFVFDSFESNRILEKRSWLRNLHAMRAFLMGQQTWKTRNQFFDQIIRRF